MNEEREEPEKFSLVFYKEERLVVQISPPRTIPVRWFYGLGEIELEDVFPLRERIGRWCGVEEPRRIHVIFHSIEEEGRGSFVIGVQLGGTAWLGPRTIYPEPEIFRKEERVEEGIESEDAT